MYSKRIVFYNGPFTKKQLFYMINQHEIYLSDSVINMSDVFWERQLDFIDTTKDFYLPKLGVEIVFDKETMKIVDTTVKVSKAKKYKISRMNISKLVEFDVYQGLTWNQIPQEGKELYREICEYIDSRVNVKKMRDSGVNPEDIYDEILFTFETPMDYDYSQAPKYPWYDYSGQNLF
jgi:hypothetical protein